MNAFHNDKNIKAKYLARVKAHAKADEIIKGQYWEKGKGCAVGCTIHSGDHAAYETELGIPRILARLEDGIFEALPMERAKTWPLEFLSAIKPGADLAKVWPEFAHWLLVDEEFGVIQFARTDDQRESIQSVADLYILKLEGADIDVNEWLEAKFAAYAAAYAAAYDAYDAADAADAAADAAAYAAAYDAAYAAAYDADAAYAAAYAADAAAAAAAAADAAADAAAYDADDAAAAAAADDAAAAAAARTKFRIAQADKLLELLKAAK